MKEFYIAGVPVAYKRGRKIIWGPCSFGTRSAWHGYMRRHGAHHAPNGRVLKSWERALQLTLRDLPAQQY